MSELIDTVKDTFKGGGKKQKMILFGLAAAAVVGVALYMRSKTGSDPAVSADAAGTGDDTGGASGADLSGLIDGFGSEIDRLDARIANLGMTGSGYTTVDGSGAVSVPNTDNMKAFAPMSEDVTVSTESPATSQLQSVAPFVNLPTLKAVTPAAIPAVKKSAMAAAVAPAPASVKLAVAAKAADVPVAAANPSRIGTPTTASAPAPVKTTAPVKAADVPVSSGVLSRLGGNMSPSPVKTAQPVAAVKPAAASPVASGGGAISLNIVKPVAVAPKSMPYSPLNPAPTKVVKLVTGKTITVPSNPSRIGG